jgi:hypothetical protein
MILASTYLSVAQWVLLLGFGTLLVVVYRQLGWAFTRLKPDREFGPAIGTPAGAFEYSCIADRTVQYFEPAAGVATLLAFVDPTCASCEALVAALSDFHRAGELDGTRVLLVTSEPESYLTISDEFQATELEIGRVTSSDALEAYRVTATPLLVAIDERGTVRAAGVAIQPHEIRDIRSKLLRRHVDAAHATDGAATPAAATNGRVQTLRSEIERATKEVT